MSLTDAPACGNSAVSVTISKLSVHKSRTAGMTDVGGVDISMAPCADDLVETSNRRATAVVTSIIVATDTVTAVGGTVVTPVSTTTGGIDASAAVTQTLAAGGTLIFGPGPALARKFAVAATSGSVTEMSGRLTRAAGAALTVTPSLAFP